MKKRPLNPILALAAAGLLAAPTAMAQDFSQTTPGTYTYTVPNDASIGFIDVIVWGAGGGGGAPNGGGSGGYVTVRIAVNPGDVISGVVGAGGGNPSGMVNAGNSPTSNSETPAVWPIAGPRATSGGEASSVTVGDAVVRAAGGGGVGGTLANMEHTSPPNYILAPGGAGQSVSTTVNNVAACATPADGTRGQGTSDVAPEGSAHFTGGGGGGSGYLGGAGSGGAAMTYIWDTRETIPAEGGGAGTNCYYAGDAVHAITGVTASPYNNGGVASAFGSGWNSIGGDGGVKITLVPKAIDLTLAKTMTSTGPHTAGSTVTFNLLVSNTGNSAAQPAIVVHDTLPAGLEYVSASGTDWACTNASQVITCTRSAAAAALAAGAAANPITVTTKVAAGATGTLANVAYVAPDGKETLPETNPAASNGYDDGNPATGSNNDASATVTVAAASMGGVQPVPTLGEWGLLLMGLLAAGLGARSLRNPR